MDNYYTYYDGKVSQVEAKFFTQLAPGQINGQGVFETLRSKGDHVFHFNEHYARLEEVLKAFKIKFNSSKNNVETIIEHLRTKNEIEDARIRIMVWTDENFETHCNIACLPLVLPKPEQYERGFSLNFSERLCNPSRFSALKSLDYQNFLEARKEAESQGFDETVLFNKDRHVAEGSYTNIFVVKGKALLTPSTRCGALKGVTRAAIMELAKLKKIKVRDMPFKKDRLLRADEIFCTNSILHIMPVTQIDGKKVNDGLPGRITQELSSALEFSLSL